MTVRPGAATRSAGRRRTTPPVALRDIGALTWAPVAAMVLLLLVSITAPNFAAAIALPVAVVGALVGVPHGAVDHLVPGWVAGNRAPAGSARAGGGRLRLARFLGLYVAAAAAAATALILAPTPTLLAFLVLSGAHFGWGEVVTSGERSGRTARLGVGSGLVAAANGMAVVGLLMWRNPAATDPYLRALSPTVADWAMATAAPGVLITCVIVATALVYLMAKQQRLETAELLLLTTVFLLCPPLAAFGVYFGLWHALRYTGRLLDLLRNADPRHSRFEQGWAPSWMRLARLSTIPTALALLAVLAVAHFHDIASLQAEVSVLLAVTFPHAAVVAGLDLERGRYAPGPSPADARPDTQPASSITS